MAKRILIIRDTGVIGSHLRHPLLALDIRAERVRRRRVFQTSTMPEPKVIEPSKNLDVNNGEAARRPGGPKRAFVEKKLARDATNWRAVNRAGVEAMFCSSGFRVVSRPRHEMCVCEPNDAVRARCLRTWNESDNLAATGRCQLPGGTQSGGGASP